MIGAVAPIIGTCTPSLAVCGDGFFELGDVLGELRFGSDAQVFGDLAGVGEGNPREGLAEVSSIAMLRINILVSGCRLSVRGFWVTCFTEFVFDSLIQRGVPFHTL
ncbi:MAG: hypothetical protein HN348_24540 [Proteobacteria bacterium]|jgi:hypothetical protein|nr:hypothetical protein [Pseudomonadota bacterium]